MCPNKMVVIGKSCRTLATKFLSYIKLFQKLIRMPTFCKQRMCSQRRVTKNLPSSIMRLECHKTISVLEKVTML
jgi:hypothetical protein